MEQDGGFCPSLAYQLTSLIFKFDIFKFRIKIQQIYPNDLHSKMHNLLDELTKNTFIKTHFKFSLLFVNHCNLQFTLFEFEKVCLTAVGGAYWAIYARLLVMWCLPFVLTLLVNLEGNMSGTDRQCLEIAEKEEYDMIQKSIK